MKKLLNNKIRHIVEKQHTSPAKPLANKTFAGNYICPTCHQEINLEDNNKNFNQHKDNCPNNKQNMFSNNLSGMEFSLTNNKITKTFYSNINFENNLTPSTPINDLFILSNSIFQKIILKIDESNFKVIDTIKNKTIPLNKYFIKITPGIEKYLNLDEHIFYGKVVIFEDVYHQNPVYRLSFSDLRKEKYQLRFKVYSNTQNPHLKKLHNQLALIPSKYKKKVNNNDGYYTLGRAVFIQAKISEKDGNLHFKAIKNIWLTDADNKYDELYPNTQKDN